MNRLLALVIVVAVPLTALAQDFDAAEQKRLKDWHSATQKAGLVTLGLAQGFGIPLMANKETLFSNGLCKAGDPMFWDFGCNGGLTVLHFAFAATTLGLFIASEVLATQMTRARIRPATPRAMGRRQCCAGSMSGCSPFSRSSG